MKKGIGFVFCLLILCIGLSIVSASDPSFCCEKTTEGAWCVNDEESKCDPSYTSAPTSCETTSYCRLGTCYDSVEGICMENTPQRTCNDNGGTWDEREIEEVSQCQLGCCVIADQAAFVSLVRCKRLSTLFGIENDYRTDITNEVSCIAEAQSADVGACVYEEDFERTCTFTTRGECGAGEEVEALNQTNLTITGEKTFYEDFLCSAEELNTGCARQAGTTCDGGDVYWTDSCGNKENVYSSDQTRSWNNGRVTEAGEVCDPNDGSNNNCGNCDYLLGTRCAEFEGIIGGPAGSEHYCQKTECVDRDGDERINGESWCVEDLGSRGEAVGSRHYREVCVDGEVRVEPCADFRNEVCLEGSIETSAGEFGTAACRVNRWQDCVLQTEEDDCIDDAKRDCEWLPSVTGMNIGGATSADGSAGGAGSFSNPTDEGDAFTNPTGAVIAPITGQSILGGGDDETEKTESNRPDGVCVPSVAPGLNFWEESSAAQICGQASARCVVVIEEGLFGGEDVIQGAECLEEAWGEAANGVCTSLGDCGGAVNYDGVYNGDGYKWTVDGEEKEL
ncbi:hypothetical protein HNV12_03465 [Methanococcoides sp. SA1]|nr:hypothetical protein [Methanococcoides sp. SA1]